jgi:hypothetical protein
VVRFNPPYGRSAGQRRRGRHGRGQGWRGR